MTYVLNMIHICPNSVWVQTPLKVWQWEVGGEEITNEFSLKDE